MNVCVVKRTYKSVEALIQVLMFTTYAPKYIRFQACEGSVTELITPDELKGRIDGLKGKLCDLHRVAVQTHHISEDYVVGDTKNYKYNQIQISVTENAQLVALEKNLDVCVLEARMDDNDRSTNPKNENNSFAIKQSGSDEQTDVTKVKGDLCGRYGDISKADYESKIQHEKERLKAEAVWLDFPMVDMEDEYGPHWNRGDKTCKSNSFAYKDAAHYNLNHVQFSFHTFSRKMDAIAKVRKPRTVDFERVFFETVFPEGNFAKYEQLVQKKEHDNEAQGMKKSTAKKKAVEGAFVELKGPVMAIYDEEQLRKAFTAQWKRNQNATPPLKDLIFKEPVDSPPITVTFANRDVVSTYGSGSATEVLKIDTRLLNHPEHFKHLDVPPFFMGTVLRPGVCDYHCVYFEHFNAMGQLTDKGKTWATILIVRQTQVEEYVKRYASPHTYFIQLPDRPKLEYLEGLSNQQGFSAGDSKFYCFRMAQYLHEQWDTPQGRRRCIIGDDQIFPFVHQIPPFNSKPKGNESEADKEQRLLALKEGRGKIVGNAKEFTENDQYRFRNTIFDMEECSMMAPGNSRFVITHAAALMYMDRVCTITKAGIVCLNNGPPVVSWNVPLKKSPSAMCMWMMDLDVVEAGLFKPPRLQSILHPAYQAAEDLLQFRIARDRGIRVVSCNTIRWRKAATATCSTAGRSDASVDIPKPFRPIIKYHDMTRAIRWFSSKYHKSNFPTVYEWPDEWPQGVHINQIDTKCWPFERYAYSYRKLGKAFSAPEFWIQIRVGGAIKTAYCVLPETMQVQWGGIAKGKRGGPRKEDLKESDIKYDGTYSAKHRMAVAIITMLNRTLDGALEAYDREKAQRDLDWAENKLGGNSVSGITKRLEAMSVGKTKTSATTKKKGKKKKKKKKEETLTFEDADYMQQPMKKQHVYQDTDGDLIYYFEDGVVQINTSGNKLKNWDYSMEHFMENNPGIQVKLVGRFVLTQDNDVFENVAERVNVKVSELYLLNPFYDVETIFEEAATIIIPEE